MSECFLVFAGGSGSMVLESVVHMAAVSALPYQKIHALMMDVDNGNGNLTRADNALKKYNAFRESMGNQPVQGFFMAEIELYRWTPNQMDKLENRSIRGMVQDNPEAVWLSHAIYTEDEIQHEVPVGFKGHPNLGVLFLENLLRRKESNGEIDRFIKAFVNSGESRIMLIGSCFGGTGAAAIPVFGRYLRTHIDETKKKDLLFGLLALEPYFVLPTPGDENLKIDSSIFGDKVKTVLSYYPNSLFNDQEGDMTYQHVYLLGSENKVVFPQNSSGKNSQVNPANLITWFACTAIQQFFALPEDEARNFGHGKLHLPWVNDATWEWDQFSPKVFPLLEKQFAQILQVSMLYISKVHTSILLLPNVEKYSFLANLLIDCNTEQRKEFQILMQSFTGYIALLVNWLFQIMSHLPMLALGEQPDAQPNAAAPNEAEEATYFEFHHADRAHIQKAFEELKLRGPDYCTLMLDSLIHQKFINAFLLCKLENRRMDYWPFEDEVIDHGGFATVLNALTKTDMNTRLIADQPLSIAINKITKANFLKDSSNVELMMAHLRHNAVRICDEATTVYRDFINGMFNAIAHFQR